MVAPWVQGREVKKNQQRGFGSDTQLEAGDRPAPILRLGSTLLSVYSQQ